MKWIINVIMNFFKLLISFLKGPEAKKTNNINYSLNNNILSKCESNFCNQLIKHLPKGYYIIPKIRMIDVINSDSITGRNKLIQKHIDFLICRANSPIIAIELDDSSHKHRQKKDAEKNSIFEKAGLKYFRIKATNSYNFDFLKESVS